MKTPISMPLRPWNRKKKTEQLQPPDHKTKPCSSSPVNLSSASSLTQSSSYSSCTGSLASTTQTKKSAEPPGWVHNPPPRTLDQEISAGGILKENIVPMRNGCQYPPSNNRLRRQWVRQGVPSPIRIRSQQPDQSNIIPSYQNQNLDRMMSDNTLQMTYSESSEGSSISSVSRDTLEPILGLNTETNDKQLVDLCDDGNGGQQRLKTVTSTLPCRRVDVETQVSFQRAYSREECTSITVDSTEQRMELAVRSTQAIEAHFTGTINDTKCSPEEEEGENHRSSFIDMNRMQDIYASMMVAFRKKIVKELREEMQKEMHQQLSALKAEINEMNNRLMDLEKTYQRVKLTEKID
eukprot:scaffold5882_cov152-Skeletonema_menzelii.AAC.2